MSMKDFSFRLKEFWDDFRKESSGLIGLGILAAALVVVVFEPVFLPYKNVDGNWRNITYWEDNPPAAPPAWTNLFTKEKSATTAQFVKPAITEEDDAEYGAVRVYTFKYNYRFDRSPLDMILKAKGTGTIFMNLSMERPDGESVFLGQVYQADLNGDPLRFAVETDARSAVYEFIRDNASVESISNSDSSNVRPTDIIFAKLGADMLAAREPLKGQYLYKIKIPASLFEDEANSIEDIKLIITGRVSGALGTDTAKRDLYSGIVAGLKWALFIGLVTSVISVLIGVLYGIISAYFGGVTDTLMSFIFEIFVSIPVLPVLIVLSAIFKPSIWIIIARADHHRGRVQAQHLVLHGHHVHLLLDRAREDRVLHGAADQGRDLHRSGQGSGLGQVAHHLQAHGPAPPALLVREHGAIRSRHDSLRSLPVPLGTRRPDDHHLGPDSSRRAALRGYAQRAVVVDCSARTLHRGHGHDVCLPGFCHGQDPAPQTAYEVSHGQTT